jgi:putative acetyltransferase
VTRGIWTVHTKAITEISARDYPQAVVEELLSPKPMENVEANKARHYVAEIDGEVVGFGAINLDDGEIPIVIVHPNYMRQGIGTRLMEKLEAGAVENGLLKLSVGSSIYGRKFYRACGFTERGSRTVKGRRTGVEFTEYPMEKVL